VSDDEGGVLAVDTASPRPAVALHLRGELFEESLPADRRASEELLPAVRRCLKRADAPLERVARLAVCAGPGSFTGLRVGLAAAWGISRAVAIPIEAVSTLEAMAEAWRESGPGPVWTALDAGRGEVVLQPFDLSGPRAQARRTAARAPRAEAERLCRDAQRVALPRDLLGPHDPPLVGTPARALALAAARAPRPSAAGGPAAIYARASAAEEKHGSA
jgi:tRNA threonylcarbamoyladenosine biosynthesis protein TsaB